MTDEEYCGAGMTNPWGMDDAAFAAFSDRVKVALAELLPPNTRYVLMLGDDQERATTFTNVDLINLVEGLRHAYLRTAAAVQRRRQELLDGGKL